MRVWLWCFWLLSDELFFFLPDLHGFTAVAELKRHHVISVKKPGAGSPRFHCRGRIEATCERWSVTAG